MAIELRILITGFIAFFGLTIIAAGDKRPTPRSEPAFAAGAVSEVRPGPAVAAREKKADAGHRAKALAALRAKR